MDTNALMLAVGVAAVIAAAATSFVAILDDPVSYGGSLLEHQSDTRHADQKTQDLWDVLSASSRILDYYKAHESDMNLDALLGSRMAEGQYAVLLNMTDSGTMAPYDEKSMDFLRKLLVDIRMFNNKKTENIPLMKELPADTMISHGRMFEQGFWEIPLAFLHLDNSSISYSEYDREKVLQGVEQLVEEYSDQCLEELLSEDGLKSSQCLISDLCWSTMTDKGFTGYSLTHQLFYFIIGIQAGCRNQIDDFIGKGGKPIEEMIRTFCSNILNEAQIIADAGYPEMRQDIFMEQGIFCGQMGYDNFFHRTWTRKVLSWQRDIGCYGDTDWFKKLMLQYGTQKRPKRAEKSMPGRCLAHRSATAIAYLAVALRTLIFQ